MFNRKVSLILMMLVFMLTISAVAAADSNSTDDIAASEVDEEPPSGVLSTTSDDELTSDSDDDQYSLSGKDVEMYYKGGSSYQVTLYNGKNPVKGADVSLSLNGVNYVKTTDDNGKASLQIDLYPKTYNVVASFGNVSTQNKIKVLPVIKSKDVSKAYKSSTKYTAKFLNSKGKPLKHAAVKFILNGKTYNAKTNAKGIASLALNLKVGTYRIYAVHPYGYKVSNKITVRSSIVAYNLKKYYKGAKRFTAKFYTKSGKLLKNKYIGFYTKGKHFKIKTNKRGIASISVISKPSKFKITSINPNTGERKTRTITVLSTLTAKSIKVFTGRYSQFKVTLHKTNGNLAKNKKMFVYVDGSRRTVKTDSKGVATVKFKLPKGTYVFKAVDPYTKYVLSKRVYVQLATIKASNMGAVENDPSVFRATLLKQNGKVAKNTKMKITLNGVTHIVKTNSKGVAQVPFQLPVGKYKVVCRDLTTGYQITRQISVIENRLGVSYNQYGVSTDGLTIFAIGRPSAAGEVSKYGYTFYQAEFERTCACCGSHELYWSIFFAGSETADQGRFPPTGNMEGGSAEGIIICAHCDADYSVFGHNHNGSGKDLKAVYGPYKTTKEMAYLLKKGAYVKI